MRLDAAEVEAGDALNVVGGDGADAGHVGVGLLPAAGQLVLAEQQRLVEERVLAEHEAGLERVLGFEQLVVAHRLALHRRQLARAVAFRCSAVDLPGSGCA